MTNDTTNTYAHECELNVAGGFCNWRNQSAEEIQALSSVSGEGKGLSKCLYAAGGLYAGQHPANCCMRATRIQVRAERENLGLIASTG
jgi:hypothetical protein